MEKATQHELQLARRMSRLGTETAFEVLNKARALERQGKSIIHLEIGEPDFDTPVERDRGRGRRHAQRLDALWSLRWPAGTASGAGRIRQPHSRREEFRATKSSSSPAESRLFSSPSCR